MKISDRRRAALRRSGDLLIRMKAAIEDEALVPWGDCLRPGKTPEMREVERRVDHEICVAVTSWPGIPPAAIIDIVKTADAIALYFEAMLWQPGALDWAPAIMKDAAGTLGWGEVVGIFRADIIERFMPLIAPRPRECWRTEVEKLLGKPPR